MKSAIESSDKPNQAIDILLKMVDPIINETDTGAPSLSDKTKLFRTTLENQFSDNTAIKYFIGSEQLDNYFHTNAKVRK